VKRWWISGYEEKMTEDMIDIGTGIHRLILHHLPSSQGQTDLRDSVDLFGDELGLDSVAVFEVLLACEEHFQIPFPVELLERATLTLGTLVTYVRDRMP
jgi:acyl carrier protein